MSGRWIRPGLRYHQQGPGHNIRWERSVLAAWPLGKEREKVAITRIEKEIGQTKRNTPKPKKRSPDSFCFCFCVCFCFCFCLCSCFTPFFYDLKASKLKKSQRQRKIRIRPSLDGYGLRTRIRTTLVRILIPGPATDPHLRIRSPVLASGARTTGLFGLILHF